jgi:hypothetical protein
VANQYFAKELAGYGARRAGEKGAWEWRDVSERWRGDHSLMSFVVNKI